MSHQAPIASRPAVEPALVTRAQRALCTILVAATLAACTPPAPPRPSPAPLPAPPPHHSQGGADLRGGVGGGNTMGFYVSTCLYQQEPNCLNLVFALGEITAHTPADFVAFAQVLNGALPGGLQGHWAVVLDSSGGNVVA